MAINYTRLKRTAERIISQNGRAITLFAFDRVADDPTKPWYGPTDPGAPTSFSTFGVFVPPNTVRQFGLTALGQGVELDDLIKMSEQIIIASFNTTETDFTNFERVVDEGVNWGITGIQILKPGSTSMLAFIGVRK